VGVVVQAQKIFNAYSNRVASRFQQDRINQPEMLSRNSVSFLSGTKKLITQEKSSLEQRFTCSNAGSLMAVARQREMKETRGFVDPRRSIELYSCLR
jgi:hypothetical protein